MASIVASAVLCRAVPAKKQASSTPQVAVVLPRVKVALVAGAAAALLAAAPAMAADVALGEEVFGNNCGTAASCSSKSSSIGNVAVLPPDGTTADANIRRSSSTGGAYSKHRTGGGQARMWQPLLRVKAPASHLVLQAACHMGGQNIVMAEKTLQKAALEQYLAGGFNEEAIVTQVENGKGAMPAWAGRLSEEEIEGVAAYVYKQAAGSLW